MLRSLRCDNDLAIANGILSILAELLLIISDRFLSDKAHAVNGDIYKGAFDMFFFSRAVYPVTA